MFALSLGPGVEFLRNRVTLNHCKNLQLCFLQRPHCFILLQAGFIGLIFLCLHQHLLLFVFLKNSRHSSGWKVLSHCGLDLNFHHCQYTEDLCPNWLFV